MERFARLCRAYPTRAVPFVALAALVATLLPLRSTGPRLAAASTAASAMPAGNLLINPSFEIQDPVGGRGGMQGWAGTVYPPVGTSNAVPNAIPLANAPDGRFVAQVSLNFSLTGSEFGMRTGPSTVLRTRAGAVYRASAQLAAANSTSMAKTAKLQLREFALGNPNPVLTQETSISLTTAFRPLVTSLTVQHTGDSVEISLLQEGAALAHSPLDSFYADAVSLVPIGAPASVNVAVLGSIPTGCSPTSPDVTVVLNTWLDTVPDFSTIQFPANACYHVEGSLVFFFRHNLVVEGHGSRTQAFTLGVNAPKPPGRDPDVRELSRAWPSHRISYVILDSTDVTLRGLGAVGPNTRCETMYSTLPVDTNAQTGFAISRSNRILLDQDRVHGVYGDLVTVAGGADSITVQGGDYGCSGNVGLHPMWATNVVFQHNTVSECGAACFSLEPMRDTWIEQHIVIDNNDVYPADPNWSNGGTFFSSHGAGGANVGDVTISNNRMYGRAIGISVEPTNAPTTRRGPFRILNNSSDTPVHSYLYGIIHLNDVNDVVVSGNNQTFSPLPRDNHGITRAVNVEASSNVNVIYNVFEGVRRVLESHYLSTYLTGPVAAGASIIHVASSPDIFMPPLLIDGELRYVANSGVSGPPPYKVELYNALANAHRAGRPVDSAPNTNCTESHNVTGPASG